MPLSKKAFTLIELLVVISIISMLIAILLPALSKAKEAANAVKCLANFRQLGVSMHTYAADYKDFLPPSRDGLSLTPPSGGNEWTDSWMIKLRAYINSAGDLMICPTGQNKGEALMNGVGNLSSGFWTTKNIWFHGLSYRYNYYFGSLGTAGWQYPAKRTLRPRRVSLFTGAASVVALGDANVTNAGGFPRFSGDYLWNANTFSENRHTNGENYLFVDGHAARDFMKQLKRAQVRLDVDENNAVTGISAYYKD